MARPCRSAPYLMICGQLLQCSRRHSTALVGLHRTSGRNFRTGNLPSTITSPELDSAHRDKAERPERPGWRRAMPPLDQSEVTDMR